MSETIKERASAFGDITPLSEAPYSIAYSYSIIYAYMLPNSSDHKDILKVGETSLHGTLSGYLAANESREKIDALVTKRVEELVATEVEEQARKRVLQQVGTSGSTYTLHWTVPVEILNGHRFTDGMARAALAAEGYEKHEFDKGTAQEWVKVPESKIDAAHKIVSAAAAQYLVDTDNTPEELPAEITFRKEQRQFIDETLEAYNSGSEKRLWYAKMRFGKTLTALGFTKELIAQSAQKPVKVLIVTHRPGVGAEWKNAHATLAQKDGKVDDDWLFAVSNKLKTDELKKIKEEEEKSHVVFASIQDLRGKDKTTKDYKERNKRLQGVNWDVLIIDESHEGASTENANEYFANIQRSFTLHLSGTPFKALVNKEFTEEEINTWDYVDEQTAKHGHKPEDGPNDYIGLPDLRIIALDIRKSVSREISDAADGDAAFNFNEFFQVDKTSGKFIHEEDVQAFLENISDDDVNGSLMPYTSKNKDKAEHTMWVMPSVAAATAMQSLLNSHEMFEGYEVLNVAGNDSGESATPLKAWNRAVYGDERGEKASKTRLGDSRTILLTVGRLTTGTTLPALTGVIMLRNTSSPEFYLQTIFRAQSPSSWDGKIKTSATVWDFAPDRVLQVIGQSFSISSKHGSSASEDDMNKLKRYLNYMPIFTYTDGNDLVEVNAESLQIELKKVCTARVLNNGFDSNLLFVSNLTELDNEVREAIELVRVSQGKSSKRSEKNTSTVPVGPGGSGISQELQKEEDNSTKNKKEPKAKDEQVDQRKNMADILKTISTRIPYMLLALLGDKSFQEKLQTNSFTLDYLTSTIDDKSWDELFLNIPKELVVRLAPAFDKDMLHMSVRGWIQEVNSALAKATVTGAAVADYFLLIRNILAKLKNPNKETVLTPAEAVKLVYSEANLGEGSETWESIRESRESFYDINSKTGLFPLYAAEQIVAAHLSQHSYKNLSAVTGEHIFSNSRTHVSAKVTETVLGLSNHPSKGVQGYHENITCIDTMELLRKVELWNTLSQEEQPQGWETIADAHSFVAQVLTLGNKGYMKRIIQNQEELEGIQEALYSLLTELESEEISSDILRMGDLIKLMDENKESVDDARFKFDYVVSNPPYQEAIVGNNQAKSLYPSFMLVGSHTGKTSIMIHPIKAFSGADRTMTDAAQKVVDSGECEILYATVDSSTIFPTVEIKGGVAITRFSETFQSEDPKLDFTTVLLPEEALVMLEKVKARSTSYLSSIVNKQTTFKFSDSAKANPAFKIKERTKVYHLGSSSFTKYPEVFTDVQPEAEDEYYPILGVIKNKRTYRWISTEHVVGELFGRHKVLVPKANGKGALGERLSSPVVVGPRVGATETFLPIGGFDTPDEAEACLKYVKTKFARLLLGTKRFTQDATTRTWGNVPLFDFSDETIIDWSKSVREIDQMLYKHFGFTDEEAEWVENSVQEMK